MDRQSRTWLLLMSARHAQVSVGVGKGQSRIQSRSAIGDRDRVQLSQREALACARGNA